VTTSERSADLNTAEPDAASHAIEHIA